MKKIILVLMMVLVAVPAFAFERDPWTMQDTILEATVIGTFFVEYRQNIYAVTPKVKYYNITIEGDPYILKQETTCFPQNPFLGRHPSKKRITSYFIATSIWHVAFAYAIPNPYRQLFQCTTIFFESTILLKNYKIQGGWHINF